MSLKNRITQKLTEALKPRSIAVLDESYHHAGHAGARPDGETHFRVLVESDAFMGQTRLARHRLINALLAAELRDGVHALAIEARAPGEAARGARQR